ncbi:Sodium/hydrogen exchanger 2 [Acropora cervicornis]|uniref:Sodium/hydrogen exchanger n=1 Tax=Acropora cervicornis TaxID=6130 RepID=A0AAD9QR20_ACRCE|nr:Sodium/hydrogen exchanger 2 [Acropora cervicornis]
MSLKSRSALFLVAGVFICRTIGATSANESHSQQSGNNSNHEDPPPLKVAKFDFERVSGPLIIIVWILIASLAKLGFHLSHKLSSVVPESCIVLEAGYFLQDRAFFDNIGTILLYAVVGTIFNTFTVGLSLFGISGRLGINIPVMHALTFASLIAAVDPVAVLAVFEEIHVNVMLYILVFGESLLNDAVTVVLYHLFESLAQFDEITYAEILKGLASFFVVSLGGTTMVIEPIFVFVMSYLSYLTAELFHFSGIMSIVTCAIIMKPYVELNISRKSHTTIKYFMKMMSSSSETLIFMFLGVRVVTEKHNWNSGFVFVTLVFILVFRALGVVLLTCLANYGRLNKLSAVDQFIMSYGGIRGAVSFSLAILLSQEHFPLREMFVTTTIGMTIKPLVRILHVKLRGKEEMNMYAELNDKEMLEYIHNNYLRRWLIRDVNSLVHDEDILLAYRRLAYKKPRETAYQDQILVNSKPVYTHHRRKHKRHGHKHHKRHNHSLKKKLSAIFEETNGGDQVCR